MSGPRGASGRRSTVALVVAALVAACSSTPPAERDCWDELETCSDDLPACISAYKECGAEADAEAPPRGTLDCYLLGNDCPGGSVGECTVAFDDCLAEVKARDD